MNTLLEKDPSSLSFKSELDISKSVGRLPLGLWKLWAEWAQGSPTHEREVAAPAAQPGEETLRHTCRRGHPSRPAWSRLPCFSDIFKIREIFHPDLDLQSLIKQGYMWREGGRSLQPLVSNPDSDFQTRPRSVGVHKVASFCHQRPCWEVGREGGEGLRCSPDYLYYAAVM